MTAEGRPDETVDQPTEQMPGSAGERAEPGGPPPAANQGKDEPTSTGQSLGRSSRTPGDQGQPPGPIDTDMSTSAERANVGGSPDAPNAVPTPGHAAGVPQASDQPLEGSSEDSDVAEGVRTPVSSTERAAGAPGRPANVGRPAAPDGETAPH